MSTSYPRERRRLASVKRMGLLDTPPEERFDRLTRMASRLLGYPIVLISMIGANRVWVKSAIGAPVGQLAYGDTLCSRAVVEDRLVAIDDIRADEQLAGGALARIVPAARCCVSVPLHCPNGMPVGALSLMRYEVHHVSEEERAQLHDLAAVIERELASCVGGASPSQLREIEAELRTLSLVAQETDDAIVITSADGQVEWVNAAFTRLTGYTIDEVRGRTPGSVLQGPGTDPSTVARIRAAVGSGEAITEEILNYHRDGTPYWIEIRIKPVFDSGGHLTRFIAVENDISERRAVEQALRQSEARYRSVVAAMHEGLMVHSADGTIIAVNKSAERILGLSSEDLAGRATGSDDWPTIRPDGSTVAPEDLPAMVTLRTGRPSVNVQLGVHTQQRGLRWILINCEPLRHAEGQPPYAAVTTISDITERKRAEDELAASEQRLRELINHAPVGIAVTDERGSIQYMNTYYTDLVGLPEEQVRGRSWLDPIHPEDRPAVTKQILEALGSGRSLTIECRMLTSSGATRWINGAAVAIRQQDGSISGYIGTAIDISATKQAEEALRRSELRQRSLLNLIPDLMFQVSADGMLLDYQPARVETLIDPTHVRLGHPLRRLVLPDLADQIEAAIVRARQTNSATDFEYQSGNGHARHDYEVRVIAGTDAGDEALVIVRDISDRKAIERMKSEFVATVSHELRTPLTSIRGALGLLAGGAAGAVPDSQRTMIEIALKNSERLVRLINDILDIEKIELGEMPFNLTEQALLPLIEHAIEANRSFASTHQVTLSLAPGAADAPVLVDSDRLMQVLTNLISNAVKHSPAGELVRVLIERNATSARISVSDNGPGIPVAFRPRVFERFAQADSSSTRKLGGTGLGLSISRAIVERLGGRISFTTELGLGTTFFVELPLAGGQGRGAS